MSSEAAERDPRHAAQAWAWRCDLRTGELIVEEELLASLGYRAQDLGPLAVSRVSSFANPTDRESAEQAFARHAAGEAPIFAATVRLRHVDGHWVWLDIRGQIVRRSEHGQPEAVTGLAADVTDQKVGEELSRMSSSYARSLLEASLDPLVTIGVDGRIMDVNAATEAATGRSRSELIGSDFSDYFTDPDQARMGYQQVFIQGRVVDFPLTLQHASGRTIDVLYNASTYHDEDGRVAGVFAAARDITQMKRAQEEMAATNREVKLLSQMSDLLQSCQSAHEAIPVIQASMEEIFPGTSGHGYVVNSDTNDLDQVLAWGGARDDAASIRSSECWALRRSSIHSVNLGDHMNPPCHFLTGETRPYVCVPLLAQGQALGLLHIIANDGLRDRDRFTSLARSVGDSISLAIANIRLRENLQALSTRDPLTGLYNRRFLEDGLARELGRAGRNNGTGVVAMIDIDHFKRFNDTHGHEAGDAVLQAVARVLQGFRQTDLPCRFGGEEFLIVLVDLTMEQAVTRMERLRHDITALEVLHAGKPLPAITVSIGLAPFPKPGEGPAAVIKCADEALYRAKEAGRDRIEVARDR